MKARRVRNLDPGGSLADNAERIVAVRLDELCAFMPTAADPAEQTALHDMRIAAKRLRYVLEVTAGCFGPYADTARKRAKELQTIIGEIHDCDEHLPEVEALIAELEQADIAAVRDSASAGAKDLAPKAVVAAPHAEEYAGLAAFATYLAARREVLFAHFLDRWRDLEREGFRPRLEYAIAERPEVEPEPDVAPLPALVPEPEPEPAPAPPQPVVRAVPRPAAPVPRAADPPASRPARRGLRGLRSLAPLRPAVGTPALRPVSSPESTDERS